MENFTNLSDRLRQFIEYKGISINKFSASVDASNSYFNKILKDNNSVGSDRIEKILRTYPEINAEWLLTGNGSMLKENSEALGKKESDSHLEKINWIIYDVKGSYSSEKHSETSLMRIALRIDQICINENISIDDLANLLNIKRVTLYEYVVANFPIPFSIIERIEQLYPHINKKWLYTGVGDYYNNETLILKAHLKEKEEKEILYKENKALLQEKVAKLEAEIQALKSVQSKSANKSTQPSQSQPLIQPRR